MKETGRVPAGTPSGFFTAVLARRKTTERRAGRAPRKGADVKKAYRALSRTEILEYLEEPWESFHTGLLQEAKETHRRENGDRLIASAMLGFDNICRNQCLYCGMRAGNVAIPRYRMEPEEILSLFSAAAKTGLTRAFLISGEDPKFGFDRLCRLVSDLKRNGAAHVSLACGEFEKAQFAELRAAGADEYVLKFEMAQEEVFNRLNPSTDFRRRMRAIESIRELGIPLASGDIVGYPGQTLSMLAEDIDRMRELEISWAPVIPYMPAANTPLAAEGGPGNVEWIWRTIALLRVMMPGVRITAGQPGRDLREGLAGREGNLAALAAGADLLFADLLPASRAADFRVVDNRILAGLDHIREIARESGMRLVL